MKNVFWVLLTLFFCASSFAQIRLDTTSQSDAEGTRRIPILTSSGRWGYTNVSQIGDSVLKKLKLRM